MPPFFPPNFMPQNNQNPEARMDHMENKRMPFIEEREEKKSSIPKMSSSPSLDVDDLVRKIDAKIAALEEEEKKQLEKEEQREKDAKTEVIGDKDSELFHKVADTDTEKEKSKKLIIEEDEEDDDFFDDFFDS